VEWSFVRGWSLVNQAVESLNQKLNDVKRTFMHRIVQSSPSIVKHILCINPHIWLPQDVFNSLLSHLSLNCIPKLLLISHVVIVFLPSFILVQIFHTVLIIDIIVL
jgi:hypothetical protein